MAEERIIPAMQTVAVFIITVNGTRIPSSVPVLSVNVMKIVNKIASATIVLHDGEAAEGRFPLSDGDLFVPGNEIEIAAGQPDDPVNIFKGIVVRQSLKIRNNRAP